MVTCPSCGSENTDNMNFCGSCGKNLSAALDASETAVRRVLANRYELVCELGRGAMGVVYLARDRTLDGREVAVKILPKEMATDSRALARLKREAMTAMEIAHPNVVRLHTFEETEDDHFLVMEYIDGPNLLHVLTGMPDGKLDVDTFLCHADGICSGVEYAHRRNVVHSDLKPANIMLDAEGTAKITDFGVAQVVRETMSRVSLSETAGTLLYMSPEVLEGAHNTVLSDQYALGITFYELLIGEPPFVRGDVTYQHIHAQPVPIPGVSEHVNDAILKALAKKPDDRWPDVETFGKALQGDLGADWEERRTILIPKVNLDDWRENDTTVRAPANGTGRLFVTSEPAEASVFIDGRQMGATGALIDTVPSGQRTVRLSFPEYDDLTRTVTIEPNRITRIDGLKLEPALPSVNIISNPLNALITFDGESAGRTPTTLRRIAEGEHTIKIVKPRYVEVERIVQVFPPVTDLEFELEAGAVEFRGRWVSEAARDGILTKETEEQRRHRTASLKEQIETALESRAWDDAEILVADLKPLEAATVSDYEERVEQGRQADREEDECLQKQWDRRRRQARIRRFWIAAAVSVGLCIGAVNLWQMYHDMQVADMVRQIDSAISAHDFGVAMVLTTELQGLEPEAAVPFPDRIRSARIAYMDGQIAQAVSEHDFDSATEITVRLSLLSTPVAEEATQRIEQARQRYISELQNDVRGAWRAGDTALRDAVFRQLRDLDPASSAFERYRYMPGECIRTITGNSDVVTSVFVTGNRVVTGAKDHTISMWNAGSGRRIRTFTGHTEEVAAVTVAGDRIISGVERPDHQDVESQFG